MKHFLYLPIAVLLASCGERSKDAVDQAASTGDPAKLPLEPAWNSYVRRTILADRTETGLIALKDGSEVKYWFRSHHFHRDPGTTRFEFPDGSITHMKGVFCCEVMLPDDQIADIPSLRGFIREQDGKIP